VIHKVVKHKWVNEKLRELVDEQCAPGFQLALGWKDQTLGLYEVGHRNAEKKLPVLRSTFFDLASLTKVLSTVSLIAWMRQKGLLESFDLPLQRWFPSLQSELRNRSLWELLHHETGLKPTFEKTHDLHGSREERIRFFLADIDASYLGKGPFAAVYSDVGFMLLGLVLEQLQERRLRDLFLETFGKDRRLCFGPIHFRGEFLASVFKNPQIAPTWSLDEPPYWLRGIPQDPRAQWMGGDAGHAGLFGTAEAIEEWGKEFWMSYAGKGVRLSDRVLRELLDRRSESAGRFRGGFDTPSPPSQAGHLARPESVVGHLGYTGCSFWMDLEKGWRITLLSHRHGPNQDPLRLNQFRPLFHDWLHQEIFSKLETWN